WTNTSTTQTGVKIERSTDNVTFTQIAVAGATAVSFSDGGLTASTTYSYRARATNAAGNSAYSNTASATTQAPPPPPTAPTNLAAAAASSTQINLSWTNGSTNQTGVKIERSTDNVTFAQITVAGATAVRYSDAGLSASTTYFYRARATNAAGDSPYSNTASAATPAPPPTGQWSAVLSWPLVAVHMTMLPNGKVLAWDDHLDNQGADVFDPATNSLNAVPFFTADLFCSGHSLLSDGRVFDAGGHSGTAHVGIANATAFDPATQVWGSLASMPVARWYPTVTALPDGRMLVTAGETNCDGCNALIPAIYDPAANSWSQLSSASQNLPYYPHMFVLPDGRVLAASSNRDAMASVVLNVALQSWAVVDPSVLDGGSAATYAPGKIVKSGLGRDPDLPGAPSVATTYVIDMTQPSPAWRQTASMAFPRTEHNLTLLPDGTVLVTGGSRNSDVGNTAAAVLEAELWSPTTETWTVLAAMKTPRMYHSTALLLPDGRVLVAGGGRDFPEVDQLSAEIYSPPYLFKGPQPAITSAPAGIQYGTVFFVGTPDVARIATASLVRLGAVTHAFDQNQRFVPLGFQSTTGGLNVQAPANANLAPPGYYLLFIVDTNGIPSVAAMVKLS
ncbi:MAG TPA: galactose oxidase-like domain-containing protein, partial [Candidatus Eisenbacteria bacterium]|nr:galactose oxidase-like domain-containing protein [Candidatus Eisenbacteria bacterium]